MSGQVEVANDRGEIAIAVDEADDRTDQWEQLRRRIMPHGHVPRFHAEALCQAYEEESGSLTGCD